MTVLSRDAHHWKTCFTMMPVVDEEGDARKPQVKVRFVNKKTTESNDAFEILETDTQLAKNKAIEDAAKKKVRSRNSKKRRGFLTGVHGAY